MSSSAYVDEALVLEMKDCTKVFLSRLGVRMRFDEHIDEAFEGLSKIVQGRVCAFNVRACSLA